MGLKILEKSLLGGILILVGGGVILLGWGWGGGGYQFGEGGYFCWDGVSTPLHPMVGSIATLPQEVVLSLHHNHTTLTYLFTSSYRGATVIKSWQ